MGMYFFNLIGKSENYRISCSRGQRDSACNYCDEWGYPYGRQ